MRTIPKEAKKLVFNLRQQGTSYDEIQTEVEKNYDIKLHDKHLRDINSSERLKRGLTVHSKETRRIQRCLRDANEIKSNVHALKQKIHPGTILNTPNNRLEVIQVTDYLVIAKSSINSRVIAIHWNDLKKLK